MSLRKIFACGLLSLGVVSCTEQDEAVMPFALPDTPVSMASGAMISAADPLAVDIGLGVLRQGGNAIDAAIAIKWVLGLVEAPETGIGGGGFVLYFDAASQQTHFYDGRETAPVSAQADRFMMLGQAVPELTAVPTGRAVGVPGMVALLDHIHQRHGQLSWAELAQPAIDLAAQGVPMPQRLGNQIEADHSLRMFADTRQYFRQQASQTPARLVNPGYARTLMQLADQGASSFYRPPLSTAIIDRAREPRFWPGDLTQQDFDNYSIKERPSVCGAYRQWRICGAPPPSSGGITLLQILGMLEQVDLAELGPDNPLAWHWILEASRLAFADRYRYIGDPDYVSVPTRALLDPAYLQQRAGLINPERAMNQVPFGDPMSSRVSAGFNGQPEPVRDGTSHISVVDDQGNAVVFTSSIEKPFGTRMMTRGFLLNNQLTDFTFIAEADFGQHPNAVEGGKRPRSSMAPILVFDEHDQLVLVIGSRGGSRIIGYVLKSLIAILDWSVPVEQAIAMPNLLYSGQHIELEADTWAVGMRSGLEALGHNVRVTELTSGVHGIQRWQQQWRGGADPRMFGVAKGYAAEE